MQKLVRKETVSFNFNSKERFNPENDSLAVAKECWDWILNPLGLDYFIKHVKDKQVMLIQQRDGFTYQQEDPEDDLISWDIIKTVLM